MTTAQICWYLCGLCLAMVFAISAITVLPDVEVERWLAAVGLTVAAVVFGCLAVAARQLAFLQRRWVRWTFSCAAVLATLIVVFECVI